MKRGPAMNDQEPEAPARLVDAMRALTPRPPAVPPAVDADILAQARERLKPAEPSVDMDNDVALRAPLFLFPRWLALAAAFVLGVGLLFLMQRPGNDSVMVAREDIDRNGRVDILDAFALARKLQAGRVVDPAFDLNGDGLIDQRDIDWIAARAVSLGFTTADAGSDPAARRITSKTPVEG